MKKKVFLTAVCFTLGGVVVAEVVEFDIPAVERMPNFPQPYEMRDWKQVAADFDKLAFDPNAEGEYLPLLRWDDAGHNGVDRRSFILPSYVGPHDPNATEGITAIGAVLGSTFAGIDKSEGDFDFVHALEVWFATSNGMNMVLNNYYQKTGASAWYELASGLIFNAVVDKYPDTPGFLEIVKINADRWHEAAMGMVNEDGEPDFFYSSYSHELGEPTYNDYYREPDMAAGIATLQYWAYHATGDAKYLDAAKRCMDWYDKQEYNLGYEVLYTFAPYIAARLNAEEGTSYNVRTLLNHLFRDLDTRRGSYVLGGNEHDGIDLSGLSAFGVFEKNGEEAFYAFAMNTFQKAWPMVPTARYDKRFSRAIGKWLLNAANASRLFYPGFNPPNRQSLANWNDDPYDCIAYEGIRHNWEDYSEEFPAQPLFASGDPAKHGWAFDTDLGIYSSMWAGIFGGIIEKTNVEGILQLDLLETDSWRGEAYPSYLYYNPHDVSKAITINVGPVVVDLYEMKQEKFVYREVKNNVELTIPADAAYIYVIVPANGEPSIDEEGRFSVDGVVVDYGYSDSDSKLIFPAEVPSRMDNGKLLPSGNWKLSTSYATAQQLLAAVCDGDVETIFTSGAPQQVGDWIQIDLGGVYDLDAVHVNPGKDWWNNPQELLVEFDSGNGIWKKAGQAHRADTQVLRISLEAERAKSVRFKIVNSGPVHWNIAEISLFGDE